MIEENKTARFNLAYFAILSLLLCRCGKDEQNRASLPAKEERTQFATPELKAPEKLKSPEIKTVLKDGITQQDLFDMIRKGVVSVSVKAHAVLERSYWCGKSWTGTGFLVDLEKGLIITNAHVAGAMKAACSFEVKFGNGVATEAKIEYIDPCYDIAVLSVDPKDIPSQCIALEMSDEEPQINTNVFSMGNTSGNEFSTYPGTIFDTCSTLWLRPFPEQSFQFSGITSGGASGSPVFLSNGKVIGLIYGGKFVSGAALPIKYVKPVVEALQKGETITRCFCGFLLTYMSTQHAIKAGSISDDFAKTYNEQFPEANSKILCVKKKMSAFEEPVELEGVQPGDILVSVEGTQIGPHLSLLDVCIQKHSTQKLKANVYRNGVLTSVYIYPKALSRFDDVKILSFAGVSFFETTDEMKALNGEKKKHIFAIAAESGSSFHDVIHPEEAQEWYGGITQISKVDGKEISGLDEFFAMMPALLKKKHFLVTYTRLKTDGKESIAFIQQEPEFAEAALYTFDSSSHSWKVKSLNNRHSS
ncbi:MAG: serine protease [Holosporales bacterium]|jgi:S1-C subfamily serine protease|nr:serine protease [Holosporales bacterium]